MKFSTSLALLATACSALVIDLGQSPIGHFSVPTYIPIPGGSPITICSNPAADLVQIDRISIDPNPPAVGKTLHLEASGVIKKRIEEGAYMQVEVKLGYVRLIKQTLDFCENIEKANVSISCPIEPGNLSVIKDQDLPKEIPPGKFIITANLFTVDDILITCLHAEVVFARH